MEAMGYLIGIMAVVALVVYVVVYIILPIVAIISAVGLCYGGYFAIKNYASAFSEVVITGNQET
jgi:hypothetical protein